MNELLLGKSTIKRRKEAIRLQKTIEKDCCKELYEALLIEIESNNWQTLVEILKALGIQMCESSADFIYNKFILNAENHSAITTVATTAFIRISRKNINDADVIVSLLDNPSSSVKEGALEALGYDKMIPDIDVQDIIITKCFTFGSNREKGYMDPRYGLAAACAGWESEKTKEFLQDCLKSGDAPLEYVAKNSLKGKYVRLR